MLAFLLLVFVASVKSQSCTGDFNQNGEVDILDLSYILDRFGTCPPGVCLGDLTGNQIRNQGDVIVLTSLWGPCFPNQTTRIGTFPPDPTTTTRVSTTTATTATTRTTAPTATLAPVITAPPVENTTQWTTSSSTTFSPDAAVLSFEPPISENCRRVEPGAYLVYWTSRVNEGAGNCEGNPVVLVRGDATNDYCFVNEYSTASSWLTDLTFLACAAGRGALCAWTATISTTSSVLDTGLKYLCTTGSLVRNKKTSCFLFFCIHQTKQTRTGLLERRGTERTSQAISQIPSSRATSLLTDLCSWDSGRSSLLRSKLETV
jgi:hypothetical protein